MQVEGARRTRVASSGAKSEDVEDSSAAWLPPLSRLRWLLSSPPFARCLLRPRMHAEPQHSLLSSALFKNNTCI
jgi:hypothetical protein